VSKAGARAFAPLAACAFVGLFSAGTAAQSLTDIGEAPAATSAAEAGAGGTLAERYERARKDLEERRAREAAARAERDRLAGEADDLRRRLIENAARVQRLESAVAQTEAEIVRLTAQEKTLTAQLIQDRARVARLLTVLQRLDADAPPALAMRPDDSLSAMRASMLLGAGLPPVYAQAASLRRHVGQLTATRSSLEATTRQSREEAASLTAARSSLTVLLEERDRLAGLAGAKFEEIHAIAEDIAKSTSDLKGLIGRIAALRAGKGSGNGPESGMVVVTPDPKTAFNLRATGLIRPVSGPFTLGDPAGPGRTPGGAAQGLWFTAAPGAQAVAPADGEVVFAGAYQKFGQVLLLEIPGGYHLLMAGLGRIDIHIGDLVLAGEPVGILGQGAQERLYLELRRGGQAVNTAPFMSAALRH